MENNTDLGRVRLRRYKIDTAINESLRIITGTLKSTPLPWLPANIAPVKVRRDVALLITDDTNTTLRNTQQSFLPITDSR